MCPLTVSKDNGVKSKMIKSQVKMYNITELNGIRIRTTAASEFSTTGCALQSLATVICVHIFG